MRRMVQTRLRGGLGLEGVKDYLRPQRFSSHR